MPDRHIGNCCLNGDPLEVVSYLVIGSLDRVLARLSPLVMVVRLERLWENL